jgi:uncharacterized protein DUF4395
MHHPDTANESKLRLTAFFVLVLTLFYLLTGLGLIPIFLVLDFSLRAFNRGEYSPLGNLSGLLARSLQLPIKPVYMPPKRFAARIGFVFFLAIVGLHLMTPATGTVRSMAFSTISLSANVTGSTPVASTILASVIVVFAALESLVNICAGCYVYNFLARLRHR